MLESRHCESFRSVEGRGNLRGVGGEKVAILSPLEGEGQSEGEISLSHVLTQLLP